MSLINALFENKASASGTYYDSSQSNTYSEIGEEVQVHYQDGTFAEGLSASETLIIGSLNIKNQVFAEIFNQSSKSKY